MEFLNLPVACVDTVSHPDWQGAIDTIGCGDAYKLTCSRVQKNLHSTYNLFPVQALPSGGERPPNGWPLPKGYSSRESCSHQTRTHFNIQGDWLLKLCAGMCSAVIKMARDFGPEALPIDGSMYFLQPVPHPSSGICGLRL